MENGNHKPLYENQLFIVAKKKKKEDNCSSKSLNFLGGLLELLKTQSCDTKKTLGLAILSLKKEAQL